MASQTQYEPSVSGNTPFRAFCEVLEKIQKTRNGQKNGKKSKEEMIRIYIEGYRAAWTQLEKVLNRRISAEERGEDLFQLIRLLLPHLDTTRSAYNMKETRLGREYVLLLGLKKDSKKAQDLLTFKHTDHSQKRGTHFGKSFDSLIFDLLSHRVNFKGDNLKIAKINESLDRMTISHEEFRKQLKYLYNHCTALEHKWLVRIILRLSLNIRKRVPVILSAIHPFANEMFAVNHNLKDICMSLYDYNLQVDVPRVTVGKPFGFMLSARTNLATIQSDMGSGEFFMETKFDGERVQVHKKDIEFSYFSRGYSEYSQVYGETALDKRTLGEYLGRSIDPSVVTCILDGEMMSFDRQKKRFLPKGGPADVKKLHVDDVAHQQCYVVFDCLYYNGRVLTDEPLHERRRILEGFLQPIEGRVQISKAERGSTTEQVAEFMKRAIEAKEEGVVVKRADSRYEPNQRDAGWVKLKPDYMNEVISDLDVLIVGAYFADAKSNKAYDALLVAVAEEEVKPPKTFYSFARIHSGLSKDSMRTITSHTADRWKPFDKCEIPRWLKMSSMAVAPDVIIQPEHSLNITVRAAELVPNRQFMTGCTVRFGRVTAVREDKPWYDCMTYAELMKLRRETGDKLVTGDIDNDIRNSTESRSGKRRRSPQRKIKVQLENKVVKVKKVKSSCLTGKEFCVLVDKEIRVELEKAIKKNGGTCVLSPIIGSTYMVVADRFSLRVREALKNHDVAKASWLVECIDNRRLRDPGPADFLGMTPETEEALQERYDRYGDSYVEDLTDGMLKNIMEDMKIVKSVLNKAYERADLFKEFLDLRKRVLKEEGFGFAGKVFVLEDGLDLLWNMRIEALHGIVVEDKSQADFLVGDFEDESNESEDSDEEKTTERNKVCVEQGDSPKRVSTSWIAKMIEGF